MGVVQNNKVRRFAFELKMQDKSSYLLAADSEVEMEEWITVLNKILQLNFEAAMQEKRNGDSHEDDEQSKLEGSGSSFDSYLPELAKSAREAEIKLKSESRVKLFYLDPDAQVRCIDGEEKIFGSCLFICLICFGLSSRYNSTENLGKRRKIKTMFSPP
uniref:Dedicator of cytokinesis protein 9-like n=1 Tax=Castor canadensis TaxID=51338 RepID=A0A8B7V0H7_CASCN|nr:dedicator of cytokinesis protein 9-like [Castor canadensis]